MKVVRAFSAGLSICDFEPRGVAAGEISRLGDFLLQKLPGSSADARTSAHEPGLEPADGVGTLRVD